MWMLYALGATLAISVSDLFRKLASSQSDPFLNNLVFQIGSIGMAIALWLLFSRKVELDSTNIVYDLAGGFLIAIFTALLFKSLALGPGVSVVIPFVRVGGLVLVVLLGVVFLKEKFTGTMVLGMALALAGVYLMFSSK